jgi:hypothetical protein
MSTSDLNAATAGPTSAITFCALSEKVAAAARALLSNWE